MMKAKVFLRVAAALVAVQAVLHTIGGVFGKPLPGAAEAAYTAMKANHFAVMGLDRSYWMFFIGFGLCMTVSMIMEAALFWMLGSLASSMGMRLRPMLVVLTLGNVAFTVLCGLFFFPIPTVWDLAITVCLVGATVTLPRSSVVTELQRA
jgi:hypothetical protein